MHIRKWWLAFAAASCALPADWAVKPGEAAPDLAVRDCSGAETRLSAFRQKKPVALLAQAPPVSVLGDTCRQLDALGFAVLLSSDAAAARAATLLIDAGGTVRRVLPGKVLTGAELAAFVRLWQSGKTVFEATCARCHGEDGDQHTCEDVKPLAGIGQRLTEAQIRERLRIGEINDRDLLIRGQIYTRHEVDAVIAYIAGL
jgi:cytochrome c553